MRTLLLAGVLAVAGSWHPPQLKLPLIHLSAA